MKMQGRRVYPDAEGWFRLEEGDYLFDPRSKHWFARAPGCELGDLSLHEITEHEDGTITVSPSISHAEYEGGDTPVKTWHGYLERGIWREV